MKGEVAWIFCVPTPGARRRRARGGGRARRRATSSARRSGPTRVAVRRRAAEDAEREDRPAGGTRDRARHRPGRPLVAREPRGARGDRARRAPGKLDEAARRRAAHELAVETFNEHTLAGPRRRRRRRAGELQHFAGSALADFSSGRPVEPDTVFRIGSISKTMTAIGVMQLVEEGTLGLDDPVNEHLRGFRVEGPGRAGDAPPSAHAHRRAGRAAPLERPRPADDRPRESRSGERSAGRLAATTRPVLRAELRARARSGRTRITASRVLGQLVEDVTGEPFAERCARACSSRSAWPVRTSCAARASATGSRSDTSSSAARLKPVKDQEIAVAPAGSVFSTRRGHGPVRGRAHRRRRADARGRGDARPMLEPPGGADEGVRGDGARVHARPARRPPHRRPRRRLAGIRLVAASSRPTTASASSCSRTRASPSRRTTSPRRVLRRLLGTDDGDWAGAGAARSSGRSWSASTGRGAGLNTNFRSGR